MKKIIGVIIVLFSVIALSSTCLASETDLALKEIGRVLIKNKEISKECVQQAKGDIRKMIKINQFVKVMDDFGNGKDETFVIESISNGVCLMGTASTPMWLFRKEFGIKGYRKLSGPDYPERIFLIEKFTQIGAPGLKVVHPATNSSPPFTEYYRYNGEEYMLVEKHIDE